MAIRLARNGDERPQGFESYWTGNWEKFEKKVVVEVCLVFGWLASMSIVLQI